MDDAERDFVWFTSPDEYAVVTIYVVDYHISSPAARLKDYLDTEREENPVVLEILAQGNDIRDDTSISAGMHYRYQGETGYCVEERGHHLVVYDSGKGFWFTWESCEHALEDAEDYRTIVSAMFHSFTVRD